MQVMLCQSDLILLHKWGLDDSQSHTTVCKRGTVVGVKLRGHFKFFFIKMSDLDTFLNRRVSIV